MLLVDKGFFFYFDVFAVVSSHHANRARHSDNVRLEVFVVIATNSWKKPTCDSFCNGNEIHNSRTKRLAKFNKNLCAHKTVGTNWEKWMAKGVFQESATVEEVVIVFFVVRSFCDKSNSSRRGTLFMYLATFFLQTTKEEQCGIVNRLQILQKCLLWQQCWTCSLVLHNEQAGILRRQHIKEPYFVRKTGLS